MSQTTIEFWFDYISPYAFLAAREIEALCQRCGLTLRWRPVLFAGLLNHYGQLGPAEIPAKRTFVFRDVARRASLAGLELRGPASHPFNPLTALRLSLHEVAGERQGDVIRALYDAIWVDGIDPTDERALAGILDGLGLDGEALLAATRMPGVKQSLMDSTREAIGKQIFGVPSVLLNGEVFWGADQLPMVERVARGEDPLPAGLADHFEQMPSSAQRRQLDARGDQ